MITIVLDAMGSDDRPTPEVQAAVIASQQLDINILLIGNETDLTTRLSNLTGDKSRIKIIHAPEAIEMSDHIEEARAKKQNTMHVGIDLVKAGEAQAFVTAGNTGMSMYFAQRALGTIPGINRPALCSLFPVKNGKCVVLDIGANAQCRPEFLVQFAQMGSIYARIMQKIKKPRVGLLSNGEEEGKGNDLVRETYPLMKESVENFIGNIEGKELFNGTVDVAVTDGFTGNVLLKSTEAVAKLIVDMLKENLMKSLFTKLGALLCKPAFKSLKKILDPSEVGAAPLLGINGLVFVGHGRSDAKAIVSAIAIAKQAVESRLLEALRSELSV